MGLTVVIVVTRANAVAVAFVSLRSSWHGISWHGTYERLPSVSTSDLFGL